MIGAGFLKEKLQRTFGLYEDFVQNLQEENLGLDLSGLPSNAIGEQLWCAVGARQSYLKAILAGGWQGFACGLKGLKRKDTKNKSEVLRHLTNTKNEFLDSIEKLHSLTNGEINPRLTRGSLDQRSEVGFISPILFPLGLLEGAGGFQFKTQIFIDSKPSCYDFSNKTATMMEAQVIEKFGPPPA